MFVGGSLLFLTFTFILDLRILWKIVMFCISLEEQNKNYNFYWLWFSFIVKYFHFLSVINLDKS